MTFDAILAQVLDLLQHQGRVAYRALKVRFNLDDDYLEALKDELIAGQRLAVDEHGNVLVWTGAEVVRATPAAVPASARTVRRSPTLRNISPRRSSPRAAPWKGSASR